MTPAEIAAVVARLRPDWRDASAFYEARSEALAGLRRLATTTCAGCPAAALHRRVAHLRALLAAERERTAQARRLLAQACRCPSQPRHPDARQLSLFALPRA
ncbi:hypothetical protein GXW74_17130 [Roseomonas eburnea]|uniref:Uncharacterized protein n=1 Tax=Neoroseomonas eburnea TaxID=1346889 RepID=A0A9X9XET1_9PROT|nr:hypothetical protein [Neoroseomonas eburnea]MBR0682217.1 hypothetical protein [Neoroseomonas eburnea]